MKIAHLILAHSGPRQLERLVNRLHHTDAYFFIHIDAKADISEFDFLKLKRNVHFVEQRAKVQWGAYSIVQATLNGFDTIVNSGLGIGRINLLSGSDYPLKDPEKINLFFERNREQNFMEFQDVMNVWKEAIPRIREYHLDHYSLRGKYQLQKWMNRLLPSRTMPAMLTAVGRSQWMSLTMEAIKYILKYLEIHPEVTRFFKLTWAPDELIFQTILFNSPFRESMVNDNLRYIDWSEGKPSPKLLMVPDLENLLNSDKLFARKFDMMKESSILDLLDQKLFTDKINF